MNTHSDICIVGNGAIGKAAALGFAQAGHRVSLLGPMADKTPPAGSWDVRVYALNHVAHKLLSSLKVWDALDADRVEPVAAMQVNGDGAKHAGRLGFDAYDARVGALAWIVEDRNLNQALDAALKFSSNITLVQGRATALENTEGRACIHLESGDTLEAELLVGADGGQSWVRGQCDIDYDLRAYGQRALVSNFACSQPHHGVAHQWFLPEQGIVALLPLPGNQVSLVWSAPDALADTLQAESLTQVATRMTALSAGVLGDLQPLQPELMRAFPLSMLRPHAIVAPQVALIGDAAHVVHPLAGHGMNLGFADLNALLQAVAERGSHRARGDTRVLARYSRARKEDILLMQLATDGLARLFETEIEPLRLLRNAGMNLIDKLPVIKRRLISHALGKAL